VCNLGPDQAGISQEAFLIRDSFIWNLPMNMFVLAANEVHSLT
jgi:hypothetical protein